MSVVAAALAEVPLHGAITRKSPRRTRDPTSEPYIPPPVPPPASAREWTATPYRWVDPSTLPPRQYVFGSHFHRGYVSVTAGSGGAGKSMRDLVDAVSMVLGKDLLGRDRVFGGKQRVWVMNLEDDRTELDRRIGAICLRYDIAQADLDGLFVDSGRDRELIIARETRDGVYINIADVEALKTELRRRQIDVLIVDPFVESHAVSESLNDQVKQVMAQWRQIAHDCGVSVELVHHIRKNGGNEASIDDVRGAVAMIGSARSVRLMSAMSEKEAQAFGIESKERRHYVSVNPYGKANFAAPVDARDWFKLETIALGNAREPYNDGDRVGVPTPWSLPGPLASLQFTDCAAIKALAAAQDDPAVTARVNKTAGGWFGRLVASHLDIAITDPQGSKEVERILNALVKAKWLREGMANDSKRMPKTVFLPGIDEVSQ